MRLAYRLGFGYPNVCSSFGWQDFGIVWYTQLFFWKVSTSVDFTEAARTRNHCSCCCRHSSSDVVIMLCAVQRMNIRCIQLLHVIWHVKFHLYPNPNPNDLHFLLLLCILVYLLYHLLTYVSTIWCSILVIIFPPCFFHSVCGIVAIIFSEVPKCINTMVMPRSELAWQRSYTLLVSGYHVFPLPAVLSYLVHALNELAAKTTGQVQQKALFLFLVDLLISLSNSIQEPILLSWPWTHQSLKPITYVHSIQYNGWWLWPNDKSIVNSVSSACWPYACRWWCSHNYGDPGLSTMNSVLPLRPISTLLAALLMYRIVDGLNKDTASGLIASICSLQLSTSVLRKDRICEI